MRPIQPIKRFTKTLLITSFVVFLSSKTIEPHNAHSFERGYDYDSVTFSPNPETKSIAKKITVKVSGAGASGSGTLIAKSGNEYTVATAWHVIKGNAANEEIAIMTPDGITHTTYGKHTSRVPGMDIGSIRFTSKRNYQTAKIAKTISGMDIFSGIGVSGFEQDKKTINYSIGSLVAYADIGIDSGYELIYTNSTVSGMSGGPILNKEGELIGIHGRGERDQVAIRKYGRPDNTKTAVNQGIPISYLVTDAKGTPVTSKNSDTYLEIASQLNKHWGREQVALRMAEKIIRNNPSSTAYYLKASIQGNLGNYNEALNNYQNAASLDNNNPLTQYMIGVTLHILGRHQEAEYYLQKTINTDLDVEPELELKIKTDALNQLSEIKSGNGNHAEAVAIAQKSIALDRSRISSYLKLANIFAKEGRYIEAIDTLENYQDKTSAELHAELHATKGLAYLQLEKYESAWYSLNKAIKLHELFGNSASNARLPNPDNQYILRAMLNSLQGRCSDAFDDIKTAESINRYNITIQSIKSSVMKRC